MKLATEALRTQNFLLCVTPITANIKIKHRKILNITEKINYDIKFEFCEFLC